MTRLYERTEYTRQRGLGYPILSMDLSHIYLHIFTMVQQSSYGEITQSPGAGTGESLKIQISQWFLSLHQQMRDPENGISFKTSVSLKHTNRSKQNATQSCDTLIWREYIRKQKQQRHFATVLVHTIIDPPVKYLVVHYVEEDGTTNRTKAKSLRSLHLPLKYNRQKRKRNHLFFETFLSDLLKREDMFYLEYIIEIIARNFFTILRWIFHECLKTRAIVENAIEYLGYDRNKISATKFFEQDILFLVFSLIFASWEVKLCFQKEIFTQQMSKNKSPFNMTENENIQLMPSFMFQIRIFPNTTLNILPYGGKNCIDMSNYLHRLGTFKDKTRVIKLRPHQLASDGFYALDSPDNPGQTKCYSCGFVYSGWQSGDDPRKIHYQNSPNCPFIRHHIELLDGTKKTSSTESKVLSKDHGIQLNKNDKRHDKLQTQLSGDKEKTEIEKHVVCELASSVTDNWLEEKGAKSSTEDSLDKLNNETTSMTSGLSVDQYPSGIIHIPRPPGSDGCMVEKRANLTNWRSRRYQSEYYQRNDIPRHPRYAVLTVRISSFQGFPCYLSQSPRQLALAGFFYLGYSDGVQCFYFGGKLTKWEPGDDPFVEHAKWFPMCLFLRETKGEEFILLVKETYRNEVEGSRESAEFSDDKVSEENIDSLYDNITDKTTNRNKVYQQEQCTETERGSLSIETKLSNGYTMSESTKYPRAFATPMGAVSDPVSLIPKRPIAEASSNITDQSMTSLVDQMVQMSVTGNLEEASTGTESGSVFEETRRLRNQRLCKVCLDQDSSIAFLPCGHLVCCPQCAPVIRKCPTCRQMVKGSIKTWLA